MDDMIGHKLRLHYEETERCPLPMRLSALLALLDRLAEDTAPSRRN